MYWIPASGDSTFEEGNEPKPKLNIKLSVDQRAKVPSDRAYQIQAHEVVRWDLAQHG
jgi:hypothetical protein